MTSKNNLNEQLITLISQDKPLVNELNDLLKLGADPFYSNHLQKNAIKIAIEHGNLDFIQLIDAKKFLEKNKLIFFML